MGFTDEYLALRAKRKKTTGNSFDDEYLELRNQRIAEEEIDDIAPVKTSATQTSTKKEEEDEKKWYQGWLQKGAFKDGYQFGDITKTLLGTDTDIATNAISGIVGWGENAVDAVATKIGEIAEKHGKQDTADKIRDFTTKDLYDEKDVSRKILSSKLVTSQLGSFGTAIRTIFTLDDWLNSKKVDDGKGGKTTVREDASILGDNADGLISSAGETVAKMGLTAATGGIPVGDIITGVTVYGSQAEQALKDGATFKQASGSGLISAGAEIMFEKLSGGIKIGGKALDDGLTQLISKNISNVALKNGVHLFKDVAGESLEEVLTEFVSKLGTKLYKEEDLADILFSEESLNDYIKAALSGGLMGGAFSGARVANSVKTGRDYGTGLTANEQKVVDKEIENRIAEEEAEGKTLSKKDKAAIEEAVLHDLEKGYIDIDTIESALGGDTYNYYKGVVENEDIILKEYEELGKKETATLAEKSRYAKLEQMVEDIKKDSKRNELKAQLSEEVRNMLSRDTKFGTQTDSYLMESYNERARSGEKFTADLKGYNDKQKAIVQKAIDSGILNNTNRSHEFVDMVAKIGAEKNLSFDFANNDKLKESGFAVDGATINGFVNKDGVTVNINSKKALNTVVGHEITHVLEGTEFYTELQKAVTEYAKAKGDYQGRYDSLAKLYNTVENADIDAELTADLVGDYLFTDSDFINNLSTKHRNVFQKIYDEVKYLCKVATAGSKEAQQLEKVKKAFEDAYRADSDGVGNVKFSLSESNNSIDKYTEKQYNAFGWARDTDALTQNEIDDMYTKIHIKGSLKKFPQSSNGEAIIEVDDKSKATLRANNVMVFVRGTKSNPEITRVVKFNIFEEDLLEDFRKDIYASNTPRKIEAYARALGEEFIRYYDRSNSADFREYTNRAGAQRSGSESESVADANRNNGQRSGTLEQTKSNEIAPIKASSTDGVFFDGENAKTQVFLTEDTDGRELSNATQKRFANSKAVDENGKLKVLYHGTASGEFSIFDKSKGNVEGDFGSGFYFTDSEFDVSEHYEDGGPDFENKVARRAEQIQNEEDIDYDEAERRAREELYKGGHKFEVYLNIENPAIVGETTLLNPDNYYSEYNREDYDSEEDYEGDVEQLIADDIDGIIWDVENNVDVYSTDGLADVLWNAVGEGGIGIEELKAQINELYLENSNGDLVGNEVARQVIESLGYDGIIDPTVSHKWNMDMEEGTTHYIVFKPNQIKAVTNQNPTDNPDIHRSLSAEGETPKTYGNYNIFGEDIAFKPEQTAAPVEDVAPVREDAKATTEESSAVGYETEPTVSKMEQVEGFAPMTEAEAMERDAMQGDRLASLDDADAPNEVEAPYYEESTATQSDDPFTERDYKGVGNKKVKAYMSENPEVRPYFQQAAQAMLGDLQNSTRGERWYNDEVYYESSGEKGFSGTKRHTTDDIAYLLDKGYSYAEIEKGLNAIIQDHGAENIAIAKRIEFALNDRLRNGYTDVYGDQIPPNDEYLKLFSKKQAAEAVYNEAPMPSDADAPFDDIPPVKASKPVAPVAEKYEAIRPERPKRTLQEAPEPQPRMVRADTPPKDGKEERSWYQTSSESEAVNGAFTPDDIPDELRYYEVKGNQKTLDRVNARLDELGYEKALAAFESSMTAHKVTLDDFVLGQRLIQEAVKRGDLQKAVGLDIDISILGTELGQMIQSLSIIQRLTPEGQLRALQRTVMRGKAKGDKAFEGVEVTEDIAKEITDVYNENGTFDQDELNAAVDRAKQKIADQMNVSTADKMRAWRYFAMLGNPKTHIRNIISNSANFATRIVKNVIARTAEDVAPIKGERTKTWKPATAEVKAFAKQVTAEMADTISGTPKYSEVGELKQKRTIFESKALQPLNAAMNFNTNAMQAEDAWFSRPTYRYALAEYLTANGIETKQDIDNNSEIVAKAKAYALKEAKAATFQQDSYLATKIGEIEQRNAAYGLAIGSIMPFKKTPINIAKAGLSYSPLGFARGLYDLTQIRSGKVDATTAIDHLSQGLTGTSLALIGYALASMGVLNGAGEDDKEGKYDYQLGKQSYSVNIGGNTYSLNWLTPVAMPLFVGANFYEVLVNQNDWDFNMVSDALGRTLDPMSEMSFLSGLDDVLSSYDSGMDKFFGAAESLAQNYLTQYIPTLVSQTAQVFDDTKRSTKPSKDSNYTFGEETWNKIKYKIPGLRQTLEPVTDIWGNEVKQSDNLLARAFENAIAPYSRKENISTEIDEEIKGLYRETGEDGLIPTVPKNYLNYNGEKYEMSAKEHTAYKQTYGQTANKMLEALFNTSTYRNATAEERADMVDAVYDYARDEASRKYFAGKGVTYTNATEEGKEYYRDNFIKGAIENDVTVEEYGFSYKNPEKYAFLKEIGVSYDEYAASEDSKDAYSWAFNNPEKYELSRAVANDVITFRKYASELYDIKADKDENGKSINGSRKEKVIDYINNLDADYGEKIILFKMEYNADDTYNEDIIEYLNGRDDISREEMESILKELGFTVHSDGRVTW